MFVLGNEKTSWCVLAAFCCDHLLLKMRENKKCPSTNAIERLQNEAKTTSTKQHGMAITIQLTIRFFFPITQPNAQIKRERKKGKNACQLSSRAVFSKVPQPPRIPMGL